MRMSGKYLLKAKRNRKRSMNFGKELKESIFFKDNKTQKTEFKTVQDVIDFLDKKYSIKDINTFANTADTWRNDAQKKADVEKEKEGYDKLFELMPDELYGAIEA